MPRRENGTGVGTVSGLHGYDGPRWTLNEIGPCELAQSTEWTFDPLCKHWNIVSRRLYDVRRGLDKRLVWVLHFSGVKRFGARKV